jgi:hypothetical protein
MSHTTNGFLRRFSDGFVMLAFVAIGACVAASSAQATPLPVASAILAAGGPGPVGGTVIANTGPQPFVSATFSGTLTSEVISGDTSNPLGGFTFTYLLTNTTGPNSIDRLTIPGYGIPGTLTNASYQTPTLPGAILPTSFDRSAATESGNVIGISFTPAPLGLGAIPPAGTSALLVIQTNANQDRNSVASIIDGSTAQVLTLAPLFVGGGPPTPEPSTLVLSILGFAGLGAVLRRRLNRNV